MTKYSDLFHQRGESAESRKAWLSASIETLCFFHEQYKGIDAASQALSKSYAFPHLRALAYASYCFWYDPLLAYAGRNSGTTVPDHEINMPWYVNGLFQKVFNGGLSEKNGPVMLDTYGRLFCATIAFNAATAVAFGYRAFQNDLLRGVLSQCLGCDDFRQAAQSWPALFDDKNEFLPWAVEEVTEDGVTKKVLSSEYIEKVQKLKPADLAENASAHYFSAAKRLRPDLFGDLPVVEACFFKQGSINGTYGYKPEFAQYYFNRDGLYIFPSLPNLIMGTLHETEHFAQWHLATKLGSIAEADFLWSAAALFADNAVASQARNKDGAVSLYGCGLDLCEPLIQAYMARPMEALAYRSSNIGYNLADAWGARYHAFENLAHADVSKIGREAVAALRIQEAAKLTRT